MRSRIHLPAAILLSALISSSALAQKQHHDPLTEAQVDKIREAGIDPNQRVKLYTGYINEHVIAVKALTNRGKSEARVHRLDQELQDVATLMDELGSNLDEYSDRHADMRTALKTLAEESQQWLRTLRALAGESGFDLSRKEAIEAGQDVADQSQRLFTEQTTDFDTHKEERGQERAEPKPE
jgi:acyl transferase domain-containing protein